MNLRTIILLTIFSITLFSCAEYKITSSDIKKEKKYYSSSGFALIFDEEHYKEKIVNKKVNNEKIIIMHNFLKINTPVRITNPSNSKSIETKIKKRANFPGIFNVVISQKVADILDLDAENPYIQIIEIKKNKTFIAKKANTFEEERYVAEKAPVKEIVMDDLSKDEIKSEKRQAPKKKFILIINDFYYEVSANKLKVELSKKINSDNIFVKKVNNNKYRLLAGPFINFNALKTTYISLNNLGFENLNIYKE